MMGEGFLSVAPHNALAAWSSSLATFGKDDVEVADYLSLLSHRILAAS
jgi:hypothetical protein